MKKLFKTILMSTCMLSSLSTFADTSSVNLIARGKHKVACTIFESDNAIKVKAYHAKTQGFCPDGTKTFDTKMIDTHYFVVTVEKGVLDSQFIAQSSKKIYCEDGIVTRKEFAPSEPAC